MNYLFFIFSGRSGRPSAVQVRLVLVPGGRCINKWRKISPSWSSGLCQSVNIWVFLKGDSWRHASSWNNYHRKCTKFCNFLIPLYHCTHYLSVPVVMMLVTTVVEWFIIAQSGCMTALNTVLSLWMHLRFSGQYVTESNKMFQQRYIFISKKGIFFLCFY